MHAFDLSAFFVLSCLMHAMPCASFCMTVCGFKAAANAFQVAGTHCFLCCCQSPLLLCCAAISWHVLITAYPSAIAAVTGLLVWCS